MKKAIPVLGGILLALGLMTAPAARLGATTSATILSLSYSSADANIHIGSNITVNMVVLNVSNQLSTISTTNPTTTSLDITSPDFSGLGATTLYITDGTRTWKAGFAGMPATTVTINDANLVGAGPIPGWAVTDYVSLQNQSFRVYIGSAINGLTLATLQMKADLGAIGSVDLKDQSAGGDLFAFDEVWSGVYSVPDLGTILSGARLYGHADYNGQPATNDNFQSPQSLTVDALRPLVNSVNFTVPSKPNYNNVMYLSAVSQGTTIAAQTNTLGRFDVTVNKVDTVVDITIGTSPVKNLPSIHIPASSQTLNSWATWKGDTGAGLYAPDGVYPVSIYIHDASGITGLTHSTQVVLTSMRYEVAGIRMLPSGMTTEPVFSDGLITAFSADVVAYRDGNGSLRGSLLALGWRPTDILNGGAATQFGSSSVFGGVYGLQETQFLLDGTSKFGIDPITVHDNTATDYDDVYVARYTDDSFPGGDKDLGNDWDPSVLEELKLITGTTTDPTYMKASYGVLVKGASPSQGNYRVRLRSRLTGLGYKFTSDGLGVHFFPTTNPEGSAFPMGMGIYCEDSSFIFQVSAVIPPFSDNTAPVFLGSAPTSSSTISPNTYGPSNSLSASFQDVESAMNADGSRSYITLTDPQSGNVAGLSTNDGGGPNNTLKITFKPFANLANGGNYIMTVNTCNNAGLCLSKAVPFTVLDQTPPSVSAVELVHLSGGTNENLSINQSAAEGPFEDISEVWVTLSIPATSTNTIDWDLSTVSLYQITGGSRVAINMTRQGSGTPSDNRLKYKINSAINYAGQFEVDTSTVSRDASGQTFGGPPAGTIKPQFTTQVCVSCVNVLYPVPGQDSSRPAITAFTSVTLTSGVTSVNPASVGVTAPDVSALPSDPGWNQVSSALASSSMQFYLSGVLQTTPLTWTFQSGAPVTFGMYYNDSDLPTGIVETDLKVRAYSSGTWSTLPSTQVVQDSLPTTGNAFRFSPISSQPAAIYYAIKYPVNTGGLSASLPTATPTALANTRAFNPVSGDALHRRARFYTGRSAPAKFEGRVFDTSGQLVRALSLGQGVSASDFIQDSSGARNYYFEWDGKNDSGYLVRNGLYLVRWTVTRADGTTESITKPVALIK